MEIKLNNTEWQEIENLENGQTYILQSQTMIYPNSIAPADIFLSQKNSQPDDNETGFLGQIFKFTKNKNLYVKALTIPTLIYIEEVE